MNDKYLKDLLSSYYNSDYGNGEEYGGYVIYGDLYKKDKISDYYDLYEKIIKEYNVKVEPESAEQKAIRLAKEKAEKRNSKIDQILGE